jgi:hypothetical protein
VLTFGNWLAFYIGKLPTYVKGWREMTRSSFSAGSAWLLAMGLTLAAAGAVFTVVLWKAYQRAETTRGWSAVPCVILSSEMKPEKATESSPTKFRVLVRYEYDFQGRKRVGTGIRQTDGPIGSEDKAMALMQSYAPRQQMMCWVNPQAPEKAVLKHDTRAALYSIWFPLLFVAGGLKMAWDAWMLP